MRREGGWKRRLGGDGEGKSEERGRERMGQRSCGRIHLGSCSVHNFVFCLFKGEQQLERFRRRGDEPQRVVKHPYESCDVG